MHAFNDRLLGIGAGAFQSLIRWTVFLTLALSMWLGTYADGMARFNVIWSGILLWLFIGFTHHQSITLSGRPALSTALRGVVAIWAGMLCLSAINPWWAKMLILGTLGITGWKSVLNLGFGRSRVGYGGDLTFSESIRLSSHRREVGEGYVFGWAGGNVAQASASFGEELAQLGSQGEKRVGEALESLVRKYGGTLVHGANFSPGYFSGADIDHVLVLGREVLLIDAKNWAYGEYEWRNGEVIRNGATFQGGEVKMADAVQKWDSYLRIKRQRASVYSMIVMAMPDASRYGIDNRSAPRAVELMAIEDLVARLEPMMQELQADRQIVRRGLPDQVARQLISLGADANPGQYYGPRMSKKERIRRAEEKRFIAGMGDGGGRR